MKSLRVAAVQMNTGDDVTVNLTRARRHLRKAAADGARLVVLPENFAMMGRRDAERLAVAEPDGDGRLQAFLAEEAARAGIWIVGGTIPLVSEHPKRPYAACLVYDETGRRVGRYDKLHLFDVRVPDSEEAYQESRNTTPGSAPLIIDAPWGRLGVAVCYDLRFPELFRKLVDRGMEVAVLPAAFTALTGKAHWEALIRARAIENLSYLVAAAQGGYHISGRETWGHSMIVNPWGIILGEVAKGSGYVAQHLDLELLRSTRRSFPSINHRRIRCE